ncbi:MAG: TetR/AcrR family transcriptional regulator [Myxococcales bacterium]|nr:TetR/AcrR family transcriptional regulator [Myxococcales bacterium]
MSSTVRQLLPRDARRKSILEAAARAFARSGYAATSMQEVAAEAGVTKLIVYRHFEGKADLYRRALGRTLELMAVALEREMEQSRSGAAVRSVLSVGRSHPEALRLLFVHALREPEFADFAAELRDRVVDLWMPRIPLTDDTLRRWGAEVAVDHVWTAVRVWLDRGDPARDCEWAERCSAGLYAMLRAWAQNPEASTQRA